METTLSLPSTLSEWARKIAIDMGISISELFSRALEEFALKHCDALITERINAAYENIDKNEFSDVLNANLESWRALTKNDAW